MQVNGGLLQLEDLARIPYPIEREPVTSRLSNMTVYTMPPPGAGRTLIEMINIIRKFPVKDRNPDMPRGALLLTEVIRRAQLDRRVRGQEQHRRAFGRHTAPPLGKRGARLYPKPPRGGGPVAPRAGAHSSFWGM